MALARLTCFALLALACTPRAGTNTPPVEVDAGLSDIVAPPADNPVAPPTDNPAVTTDACVPQGAEGTREACTDGRDNDCDGFADCTDPGCAAACAVDASTCVRQGNEDDNAQCNDGRDNDCDGFFDCNDFSCRMNPAVTVCATDAGCVPSPENTNTACGDQRDNDCDGFVDCNDFNCSRNPAVTVCAP